MHLKSSCSHSGDTVGLLVVMAFLTVGVCFLAGVAGAALAFDAAVDAGPCWLSSGVAWGNRCSDALPFVGLFVFGIGVFFVSG